MLFPNYNEIKADDEDDDDDDDDNVELLHFREADAMEQELSAVSHHVGRFQQWCSC